MLKYLMSSKYCRLVAAALLISLGACKKFVQVGPPTTEITGSTVYSNNASAASVMTGLYSDMVASPQLSSGVHSIGYSMGLAADELTNYNATNLWNVQFYTNALSSFSNGTSNYYFWTEIYNGVYVTNAVLEGIATSTDVSGPIKQQLIGEAKFMRAFFYFYGTNLYGDIPWVLTTNYQANNTISRTPQAQVYQGIVADLQDAESKLSAEFVDAAGNSTSERTRPNRAAAAALLAKVYLYLEKWDSAEAQATGVIGNSNQYSLDSLNSVFLANSTEAIWQLQPVTSVVKNSWDATGYVLTAPPGTSKNVALSPFLTAIFENGDERWTDWVGAFTKNGKTYYYPYKYKVWKAFSPTTEYMMVLRLGEQYLIRAEARAEQNNITGAVADLNVIRNRAALSNYSGPTDQQSVLAAILHERQVELFTEWGNRWFDLKRNGNLNSVMGAPGNVCTAKSGNWNPDWALLPIALGELQINSHLTQNSGYN